MEENKQDKLALAFATLKPLRNNIAEMTVVEEKYVHEFHTALDKLKSIGIDVSEFFIPDSEVQPRDTEARAYVDGVRVSSPRFSKEKYVDKSFMLYSLDKTLSYLDSFTSDKPEKPSKMDFSAPIFPDETAAISQAPKPTSPKTVFIVHGRNDKLRESMFNFLRALGLNPVEWSQAIQATQKSSPYIGEILDTAFGQAQAIIVMFSGDDEARLREEFWRQDEPSHEKELTPQPRPNVIFEAGMAMGRSEDRTILVQVGKLRPISDIAGRHITHLDNSSQKRQELVTKLRGAGCEVNTSGTDWLSVGNFQE